MEKAKIIFLGTGDAVPTKKRNHTSILLNFKSENILIDCGEGTQRQIKKANINPCSITRILITHWHGDHILGIPGLLKTLALIKCNKTIKLYGPRGTKRYMALLEELMAFDIPLEVHEVSDEKFIETPDFYIETKPMLHTAPSNAYSFVIKDKKRLDKEKLKKYALPNSPLLKKLQQGQNIIFNGKKISSSQIAYIEKGKKFTFILDTAQNENAVELAKNSDILIIESTFLKNEEDQAVKFRHLTLEQAVKTAKKAKVKSLILTHISQRYENNLSEIEKEAKKLFKNASLAKDFDVLEM